MKTHISTKELVYTQIALYLAVILQITAWRSTDALAYGTHPLLIITEISLAVLLALTVLKPRLLARSLYRTLSFLLLGLISIENISAVVLITNLLVTESLFVTGYSLLGSALAIFMTNIIVFALWYWEIDSPGLSGKKWSKHDKDFQFTQQDTPREFPHWQPQFIDYLYLSLTNAINFAAADARPLTHQAKVLMAVQALVSVSTLALIVARSVSILGQ